MSFELFDAKLILKAVLEYRGDWLFFGLCHHRWLFISIAMKEILGFEAFWRLE